MKERWLRSTSLFVILYLASITAGQISRWDFTTKTDLDLWLPNAHMGNVRIEEGVVKAKSIGSDPFLLCRKMSIQTSPYQYVVIRIKASQPGIGELFWSGQLHGQYGGLTEVKKVRFAIRDMRDWQEIVLFPFWHTADSIRQLRLDLYEDAEFEIDWIEIRDWDRDTPRNRIELWEMEPHTDPWRIHPQASERFAPPVEIDTGDKMWVSIRLASDREGIASVLWANDKQAGMQSETFELRGNGQMQWYDIHMAGLPAWQGRLVVFGLRLPEEANVQIEQIQIGTDPQGPARLEVSYFGFEDAINRAGRPCKVMAQVVNRGGRGNGTGLAQLFVPSPLTLVSQPEKLYHACVEYGEAATFVWEIKADTPGDYRISLAFSGRGSIPPSTSTPLHFTEPPAVIETSYVPEPKPVKTDIEICAFYFPGWDSDGKWDCIGNTAPIRKPLLGYYDESNPECVDWQIKWALENGISCFLVDWYWVQGHQHLTHWFEAYRRCKYRDQLKVAIMWANHNPPGTHSTQDWLDVTQYWIDHYFNLPSYYKIDGKPAVFIWDTRAIRSDLGDTAIVRDVFQKSQEMVAKAGFGGITLIAMENAFSAERTNALKEEGYAGVTTYHEWGSAIDTSVGQKRYRYEDVVTTSPAAWQRKHKASSPLTYYPLVDTGWDSRPWHGNKAMAIEGRTPKLFEQLLRQARSFCHENNKNIVILGPVNEWGEGSYIEPCTEFGFEMMEAVRRTFAQGPASTWPANLAPTDIGLGPYDFPPRLKRTTWTFDNDAQGWSPLMNIDAFRCQNGVLQFHTTSFDSALVISLNNVKAFDFNKIQIRMQLRGNLPPDATGQLFWSQGGAAITEAGSIRFTLNHDAKMTIYEINLAEHPRWRGRITSLRLDPCPSKDIDITLDKIQLSN